MQTTNYILLRSAKRILVLIILFLQGESEKIGKENIQRWIKNFK